MGCNIRCFHIVFACAEHFSSTKTDAQAYFLRLWNVKTFALPNQLVEAYSKHCPERWGSPSTCLIVRTLPMIARTLVQAKNIRIDGPKF